MWLFHKGSGAGLCSCLPPPERSAATRHPAHSLATMRPVACTKTGGPWLLLLLLLGRAASLLEGCPRGPPGVEAELGGRKDTEGA